jgi:hypothetical protein
MPDSENSWLLSQNIPLHFMSQIYGLEIKFIVNILLKHPVANIVDFIIS